MQILYLLMVGENIPGRYDNEYLSSDVNTLSAEHP